MEYETVEEATAMKNSLDAVSVCEQPISVEYAEKIPASKNLFITNLSLDTTEKTLMEVFPKATSAQILAFGSEEKIQYLR